MTGTPPTPFSPLPMPACVLSLGQHPRVRCEVEAGASLGTRPAPHPTWRQRRGHSPALTPALKTCLVLGLTASHSFVHNVHSANLVGSTLCQAWRYETKSLPLSSVHLLSSYFVLSPALV